MEGSQNTMKWKGLVIHHSGTVDSETSSWEAIRHYHIHHNRWSESGYHFGVEDVDGIVRVRIGRPTSRQGAHEVSFNRDYLGLVIVGDFDKQPPSEIHLEIASQLIIDISRFYNFPINSDTIKYHKDAGNRTCPGRHFPEKHTFIERLHRRL